jgi:hypothetical protein
MAAADFMKSFSKLIDAIHKRIITHRKRHRSNNDGQCCGPGDRERALATAVTSAKRCNLQVGA